MRAHFLLKRKTDCFAGNQSGSATSAHARVRGIHADRAEVAGRSGRDGVLHRLLDRRRSPFEREAGQGAQVVPVLADQVDLVLVEADDRAEVDDAVIQIDRVLADPGQQHAVLEHVELLDGRLAVEHAGREHSVVAVVRHVGGRDVVDLGVSEIGHRLPGRRLVGREEGVDLLGVHGDDVARSEVDRHQLVLAEGGVADRGVLPERRGNHLDLGVPLPGEVAALARGPDHHDLVLVPRTGDVAVLGEADAEEGASVVRQGLVALEEVAARGVHDAAVERGQVVEPGPVLPETADDLLDELRRDHLRGRLGEVSFVVVVDVDHRSHLGITADRRGDDRLLVADLRVDVVDDVVGGTDHEDDAEGGGETERGLLDVHGVPSALLFRARVCGPKPRGFF